MFVLLFPTFFAGAFGLVRETFGPAEEIVATVSLDLKEEGRSATFSGEDLSPDPAGLVSYSNILISEVVAGTSIGAGDEFVELYNPNDKTVSLTGWSIKKRSGTGSESSLVSSSRFKDKRIPPHRYFLIAHEGGYVTSSLPPDVLWPKSYSLSPGGGILVLYDPGGTRVDEVSWGSIPNNQALARISWEDSKFFLLSAPTPQTSSD